MVAVKILGLAGSARTGSFNKKLVQVALQGAESSGASCTYLDLREYPLPIYDGDTEASGGLPENAVRLREIFTSHEGLIISAPEYNGSIAPLLKNTLDWISRSPQAQPDLSPYRHKVAAIMAASPGPLGGLRGLGVVRSLLNNLGITVLSTQVTLRGAHEQFSSSGDLLQEDKRAGVADLGAELAETTLKLKAV
jgi:chromate reductase